MKLIKTSDPDSKERKVRAELLMNKLINFMDCLWLCCWYYMFIYISYLIKKLLIIIKWINIKTKN